MKTITESWADNNEARPLSIDDLREAHKSIIEMGEIDRKRQAEWWEKNGEAYIEAQEKFMEHYESLSKEEQDKILANLFARLSLSI